MKNHAFDIRLLSPTEEASLCDSREKSRLGRNTGSGAAAHEATPGESSYLDPAHPELGQGSTHLGRRRLQVFPAGDDFDQQGVVMWGDDGSLEGRGAVQTDPHALTTAEDLVENRTGRLRRLASASEEKSLIATLLLPLR